MADIDEETDVLCLAAAAVIILQRAQQRRRYKKRGVWVRPWLRRSVLKSAHGRAEVDFCKPAILYSTTRHDHGITRLNDESVRSTIVPPFSMMLWVCCRKKKLIGWRIRLIRLKYSMLYFELMTSPAVPT